MTQTQTLNLARPPRMWRPVDIVLCSVPVVARLAIIHGGAYALMGPLAVFAPLVLIEALPTIVLLLKCIWLPAKAHGRTKQGDELAMPVTLWLLAIDLILTSFLRAH